MTLLNAKDEVINQPGFGTCRYGVCQVDDHPVPRYVGIGIWGNRYIYGVWIRGEKVTNNRGRKVGEKVVN
jgi:hypothetical protein